MSVRDSAVKRAIQLLKAVDAKYKIILPDGTEHGNLKVAKKRKYERHGNDFAAAGYVEKITSLGPGDCANLPVNGFDAEAYRGAIASCASRRFGKGSCITYYKHGNKHIEVLRVR